MSRPSRALSGGDYAFLAFVARGLETAYEIKRAMSGSVSFFWSAAHSQVYQQAARLVRDGYVREREERAGRRRKILSLTPKGRRALAAWLGEPASITEFRDEMLVKVFFADLTERTNTVAVLEEARRSYEKTLETFRAIEDGLVAHPDDVRMRHGLHTVRLGIRIMRAYLDWLEETTPRI